MHSDSDLKYDVAFSISQAHEKMCVFQSKILIFNLDFPCQIFADHVIGENQVKNHVFY